MNRMVGIIGGLLLLTSGANAIAEGSKIGFVNINLLLQKVPQAEAATKRLEAAFGARKSEILDFQKKCRTMEEELEKERAALSQQQLQKQLRKIRSCSSELKLMDEEYGEDLRIAQAEELQKLQREVYQMVDRMAREEQFDLIVNESILYASPRVDLSLKVLEALKEKAVSDQLEPKKAE